MIKKGISLRILRSFVDQKEIPSVFCSFKAKSESGLFGKQAHSTTEQVLLADTCMLPCVFLPGTMKRTSTSSTLITERESGKASESELQTQILNNPYISFDRLEELLNSKFGGNWRAQVGVMQQS